MTARHLTRSFAWLVTGLAVLLAGCATTRTDQTGHFRRPCPVTKLALAPFQEPFPCDDPGQVICPFTAEIFPKGQVPEEARRELTARLPLAAEKALTCRVIPPWDVAAQLPARPDQPGPAMRQALAQAAREMGAETIVTGTVFNYRERVGSSAGITQPASVNFNLYAIDAASGEVIWTGTFKETQRSLSENLLQAGEFFSRGGRWLTAAELAEYGLAELFSRARLTRGN